MDSVFITGCSTGIGYCVAHGLKSEGYRVIASCRKQQDVERLEEEGFEVIQLDVSNSSSIEAAVAALERLTDKKLYGLFNNAGYGQPGAVEDLSRELLREQFETNVFGLHELTCKIIPWMREQGRGRIIQHSSVLGFIAMQYRGAYNASKYAIEGLTDTLRQELHGSGVYVSLIETGPVTSKFRENALDKFLNKIDYHNSAHSSTYQSVLARLQSEDSGTIFTRPPQAVLQRVSKILQAEKPRPRYYVTIPTYILGFLKRVLPSSWLDWVLIKLSEAENK